MGRLDLSHTVVHIGNLTYMVCIMYVTGGGEEVNVYWSATSGVLQYTRQVLKYTRGYTRRVLQHTRWVL